LPPHGRGIRISEWGAHDRREGTYSTPRDLLRDLHQELEPHPINAMPAPAFTTSFSPCDHLHREAQRRTVEEEGVFLDRLLLGADLKGTMLTKLLGEGRWDLFIGVFGESHCVGHQDWYLHDVEHPWHDPA